MAIGHVSDELIALEQEGWQALSAGKGTEFYSRLLDLEAVMVMPSGVFDREASLMMIDDNKPWSKFSLSQFRYLSLGEDAAVMTYHAKAERPGMEYPFDADLTSVYARRDGGWRLVLHQQTLMVPLAEGPGQGWSGVNEKRLSKSV